MKRTLLAALLFVAACRGGGASDDSGDDVDGGNTDDVKIQDVQGSMPVDGTAFNIRGVVVTVIDNYGERKGNIFIEEPEGGERSGVLVFGIELGDVSDLEVGDVIDLEGVTKDEFALTDDTSGRTTTELSPVEGGQITVTVTGHGDVPEPELVDSLAIGQMTDEAARDDEWEKWEGVLIKLENVSVVDPLDQIGSTPQDPPFEDIRVTGPLSADTSLSAINEVTRGECLASITGVGDYFFNYKILPRSTDDIVTGGTGCPEQEATETECTDDIDNDADGFSNCDDFSCQVLASCSTTATVVTIQNGTIPVDSNVSLADVFITALDTVGNNKGIYVSDSATPGAYDGVYVYTGTSLPAGAAIGATADVTGQVEEFDFTPPGDTLTELGNATVTVTAGTATLTPLGGIAADTLSAISTGEQYESVLVTLTNMKVMTSSSGFRYTLISNDAKTIVIDDDVFASFTDVTLTAGTTCLASITGVMGLNGTDDQRRLYPRNATDFVTTGGTCN